MLVKLGVVPPEDRKGPWRLGISSLRDKVSMCTQTERERLTVNKSGIHGWGLTALQDIPQVSLIRHALPAGRVVYADEALSFLGACQAVLRAGECSRECAAQMCEQTSSASRNPLNISNRDPKNTPEYSEFLYLYGNKC